MEQEQTMNHHSTLDGRVPGREPVRLARSFLTLLPQLTEIRPYAPLSPAIHKHFRKLMQIQSWRLDWSGALPRHPTPRHATPRHTAPQLRNTQGPLGMPYTDASHHCTMRGHRRGQTADGDVKTHLETSPVGMRVLGTELGDLRHSGQVVRSLLDFRNNLDFPEKSTPSDSCSESRIQASKTSSEFLKRDVLKKFIPPDARAPNPDNNKKMNDWCSSTEMSLWAPQHPWAEVWDAETDWESRSQTLTSLNVLESCTNSAVLSPSPLCNTLSQDVKAAVEEIDSIVSELWRTAIPRDAQVVPVSVFPEGCSETRLPSSQNNDMLQIRAVSGCESKVNTSIDCRPKHKCDRCDKCYFWLSDLMKHQKLHSGERYQCSECEKTYVLKSDLCKHQRSHQGEKAFLCKFCDKSFISAGDFHKHTRIHTGERPYFCTVCSKSFSASDNFRKHLKIHSGDKPLECLDCGQRFLKKSNLQQHSKIHLGEKPFQCETCGLSFTQKTHLKTHISTHTGVKPYLCSLCNQRFTRNADLKRHLTRAHAEGTENRGL
ncbi:Zinc finger protein 19 [Frankliniella fusca]|uniref:Zinc finger protein 19 n=1 Tax=Frankliniella fusca TaxID=407009 RepID=A0AAE1GTZ3_9NEOP|nr:Zinc finger protein 19 [Frankliniella fusca]